MEHSCRTELCWSWLSLILDTGMELLRWDGAHYEIAPHFQEDGTIYTAGYVHSSALLATRLPRGPAGVR